MNKQSPFSWRTRARSFGYAWQGIVALLRDEHNARIHLAFAVLACILGLLLQISLSEWLAVLICMALVFATEAMNTAVEALCNKVSPEYDEHIKKSKDCAAAAVFITAMISALIGALIFAPKLWGYLSTFLAI